MTKTPYSQLRVSPTFAWILKEWTLIVEGNVEINVCTWGNQNFNKHYSTSGVWKVDKTLYQKIRL